MPTVLIQHPDLGAQKTYTTAEVSASATSSLVENNDDFASGDLVLFGKYGQEKSEIVVLTGVTSNNQIDHATGPVFSHPARTPVYQLQYNQAEIYRATSEGGSYTLITTVGLNVDETDTVYIDTGGTTSSWYKFRYKNSQTAVTSDYSDEVQGTGYEDNSLASMVDEVLLNFGDPDAQEVSREQVERFLNAGVRRVVMQIMRMFPDYFGTYTTQALSADTTYSYPTNFIAFKRVQIGSTLGNSYKAHFMKESELDPSWTYAESNPRVVMRDTSWKTYPDCAGKTAYIYYWQYPSTMSNDTDTHGLPYGGRDVLVTYALYRIWLNKDPDRATMVKRLLDSQMEEYLEFVGQSRQASGNYFQEIVFGDDDYVF